MVKAGVATFAASNPEVAEVEVVRGRRRYVRRLPNPEVAEVEVVGRRRYVRRLEPRSGRGGSGQAGVATFAASNSDVADMELVDVGLVKATDGAEITGTAASSSHPVPLYW